MAYSASQVAKWILWQAALDGVHITPLKLQKILYYAQGNFIGMSGNTLFYESIEAWTHGPVVSSVYSEYRHCRSSNIPIDKDPHIPEELTNFVGSLIKDYGRYSAIELRNKTHAEPPYMNTEHNDEITIEKMSEYFTDLLWAPDDEDSRETVFYSEEEAKQYFKNNISEEERLLILDACS